MILVVTANPENQEELSTRRLANHLPIFIGDLFLNIISL
jgi:hypothetical protein